MKRFLLLLALTAPALSVTGCGPYSAYDITASGDAFVELCASESATDFCRRHNSACGVTVGRDPCGRERSEVCGPPCCEEAEDAMCARLELTCGRVNSKDRCGVQRNFLCGGRECCVAETDRELCGDVTCGTRTFTDRCQQRRQVDCGDDCCVAETNAQFCQRLGFTCGQRTARDNCGADRSVLCGNKECCVPETTAELCQAKSVGCGPLTTTDRCGNQRNVQCALSCCAPEDDATFCSRTEITCSGLRAEDNCGTLRTATCGPPREDDEAFCGRMRVTCGEASGVDNCGRDRTADCGWNPEDDLAFCTRYGVSCGEKTARDNCGVERTATCGEPCCTPSDDQQICAALGRGCGTWLGDDTCGGRREVTCGGDCEYSAMKLIAAGPFTRGCDESAMACSPDTVPLREITLSEYLIDESEVTQARYDRCVLYGLCAAPPSVGCHWDPTGNASLPVSCVSWFDAARFCNWLGKRLPTEAEWERAARGTQQALHPWGAQAPTCSLANYVACAAGAPLPVGTLPEGKSPDSLKDMAGNVAEWVADYYDVAYYAAAPQSDPPGAEQGNARVVRGGGYDSDGPALTTFERSASSPSDRHPARGFRCAATPPWR